MSRMEEVEGGGYSVSFPSFADGLILREDIQKMKKTLSKNSESVPMSLKKQKEKDFQRISLPLPIANLHPYPCEDSVLIFETPPLIGPRGRSSLEKERKYQCHEGEHYFLSGMHFFH